MILVAYGIFNNLPRRTKIKHTTVTIGFSGIILCIAFAAIFVIASLPVALFDISSYDSIVSVLLIVFGVLIPIFCIIPLIINIVSYRAISLRSFTDIYDAVKSQKRRYCVSTNSLVLVVEALIFFVQAGISIFSIVQINKEGYGLLKAGAGLYACAVISCIAAVALIVILVYLAVIRKQISHAPDVEKVFEHNLSILSIGLIASTVIAVLLYVFTLLNNPVWSLIMHIKADDLELGMTEYDVTHSVLGEPSYKDGSRWYYFDKGFERKFNEANAAVESAEAEESLGAAFEAYQMIDGETYSVVVITFDDEKKVSEVMYDTNRIYDASGDEEKITEITALSLFDDDNNLVDTLEMLETRDGMYLLSKMSDYVTVVGFDDHDFIKRRFNSASVFRENGKIFLKLVDKNLEASHEIKGKIISLDENGVCRIGDNISTLRSNTFYSYADEVKEIYIPKSVNKIEPDVFVNFNSLEKVYIDDIEAWCSIEFGNENANPLAYTEIAYLNDSEIFSLVIPDGTERISDYAFIGADFLTEVSIPDSVSSIGMLAFEGVPSVCEYSEGLYYVDGWVIASDENIDAPSFSGDVRGIAKAAFTERQVLKNITLPTVINHIPDNCFKACTSLEEVYVLGDVYSVGEGAFNGCKKLRVVSRLNDNTEETEDAPAGLILSNALESIGAYAFYDCAALEEVYAPSVEHLGDFAFDECDAIKAFTILSDPSYVGENPLPEYIDKLKISANVANKLSKSHASEIIIEGGDFLDASITITTRLSRIEVNGIQKASLKLHFGGLSHGEAWYEYIYSSYPKNANTTIVIGNEAREVRLSPEFLKNDSYYVDFEDPDGWSFIQDYSIMTEAVPSSSLNKSSSYHRDFSQGLLKKGDIDFIRDVLLNETNKGLATTVLGGAMGLLGIVILFIDHGTSPTSRKRKAYKNGEVIKIRVIDHIIHIALIIIASALIIGWLGMMFTVPLWA